MAIARRQQGGPVLSPQPDVDIDRMRREVEAALLVARVRLAALEAIVGTGSSSGPSLAVLAPVNVTGAAAAVGVGTTAARDDHRHDIDVDAVLDTVDATRGTLLSRGAAGWRGIDPGTATHVLTSNGAGADPTYQASAAGLTQEQVEDIVGALIVDSDTTDATYTDATPSITIAVRDTDAARWVTVRDLDFAGWADTNFAATADGTHSLNDGTGALTWNKLNRTAADGAPGFFRKDAAGDSGDDGGDGLRIVCDASLATTLTTGANTAPQLWISLGTLDPDYDETAEYVLQLHVTRLTESGTITASQPTRFGLFLHAPSGTPTGTAVRVAGVVYRRIGAGDWRPCIETSATTDTSRTDQAYSTSNVLSLHLGPKGIQGYSGLYSGGWPTMRSLTSVGFRASAQSGPNWVDVYNHRDTRMAMVCCSGVSNTGSIDVMARHLRLLRRRT